MARHKGVIANVLRVNKIKSVSQRLLLKLVAMGQPMLGIAEGTSLVVSFNWCVGFPL